MRNYLFIGPVPHEEPCAQVGEPNYQQRARRECRRFAEQIIGHYPPPDGSYVSIKAQSHDFGTYYEVVVVFDDEDEESSVWAYDVEVDRLELLRHWDEPVHEAEAKEYERKAERAGAMDWDLAPPPEAE